mmetsp:Transcript_16229/g.31816  ORF Transcript_16229/g.31816 Transcript_16229/m.31816 type:complete len:749 (+) Transcript_16229:40-2286(+)|eukprot:CAMPEP_0175140794 /NCGR_PEP_ID=MMETSP0087-20121206/11720_1 /TAXON_ID=136419 /ORGANISM="Unknown Unknown, Strain D1" /LENGTH=748 /DNA_ID=CAMNT_0016424083 /DNA_START=18 /DNA_END=2264 /DNA_ORIENTATION=+
MKFTRYALVLASCFSVAAEWLNEAEVLRQQQFVEAFHALNVDDVKEDLKLLFKTSQPWWPADYGHYGPFFIRLAWHCSGSYRVSDGRGGCSGGRQRFDPERSWDDNTNLDKARKLLVPIKEKYGLGLSWGDLFILAGTTAIEDMGGPVLGFCGGRVDDPDGSQSLELGPTEEQEQLAPCKTNGECKMPLGSTTVGLIYLNPEGPMGSPEPDKSCVEIKDTFGRMAMNDTETVALIGGGHSFGKTHGACPTGPGPRPSADPENPWPGTCTTNMENLPDGKGIGANSFTSGFEGPWTMTPTSWDNSYFTELLNNNWTKAKGPGGHWQWGTTGRVAPDVHNNKTQPIMMLTTDVSLINEACNYKKIVEDFAKNPADFNNSFAHAWYKLTTRDVGPISRCLGKDIPPVQAFQYPLPAPPPESDQPDWDDVKKSIKTAMTTKSKILDPDTPATDPYYGAMFTQLAWQCSNTWRVTDYQGGCNGARIRLAPQKDWPVNKNLDKVFQVLESVKTQYATLSYSDLIVLAGQVALEDAGATGLTFCPGRTDAVEGDLGSQYLEPRSFDFTDQVNATKESQKLLDLTDREMVALHGRLRSNALLQDQGFHSNFTANVLSTEYFQTLTENQWEEFGEVPHKQYKAVGKDIFILKEDYALTLDSVYNTIALEFASSDGKPAFLNAFSSAWTKVTTADRYDGPVGNLCHSTPSPDSSTSEWQVVLISIAGTVLAGTLLVGGCMYWKKSNGYSVLSQNGEGV